MPWRVLQQEAVQAPHHTDAAGQDALHGSFAEGAGTLALLSLQR